MSFWDAAYHQNVDTQELGGSMLLGVGGGAVAGYAAATVAPAAAPALTNAAVQADQLLQTPGGQIMQGAGENVAADCLDGCTPESAMTSAATGAAFRSIDFIGQARGPAVAVPDGAIGPIPAENGKGFQFVGGNGGKNLSPRTTGVRIMDPTLPNPPSPGYPNGYASYSMEKQTINPYTGHTIGKKDPMWHIPLDH